MRLNRESLNFVRRAAPAKLNLYLHVLGRRDDGYHLLDRSEGVGRVIDTVLSMHDIKGIRTELINQPLRIRVYGREDKDNPCE